MSAAAVAAVAGTVVAAAVIVGADPLYAADALRPPMNHGSTVAATDPAPMASTAPSTTPPSTASPSVSPDPFSSVGSVVGSPTVGLPTAGSVPVGLPTVGSRVVLLAASAPTPADTPARVPGQVVVLAQAASLDEVFTNLRTWILAIFGGATLVTWSIAGLRYSLSQGDPEEVGRAKAGFRAGAVGFAITALAPLGLAILGQIVEYRP